MYQQLPIRTSKRLKVTDHIIHTPKCSQISRGGLTQSLLHTQIQSNLKTLFRFLRKGLSADSVYRGSTAGGDLPQDRIKLSYP